MMNTHTHTHTHTEDWTSCRCRGRENNIQSVSHLFVLLQRRVMEVMHEYIQANTHTYITCVCVCVCVYVQAVHPHQKRQDEVIYCDRPGH